MLGGSESSKAPPQIIGLNLDMRYVEQILEHVMRKGKSEPVQLCLGEEPVRRIFYYSQYVTMAAKELCSIVLQTRLLYMLASLAHTVTRILLSLPDLLTVYRTSRTIN